MTENIVHLLNISKTVKNDDIFEKQVKRTLWKINELQINKPGFYVIAGKNGCGKSTLIRCMLGLLRPDQGQINWFDGQSVEGSLIGYLPEFPVIPPSAKVKHWLSWLLDVPANKLSAIETQLSRFATLAVAHLFEIPANRLSKGQQQRVQLWAAMAKNPKVIILDEPFSGLDPWARVELAELISSLLAEGKTVFMSTHELPVLLRERTSTTWLLENSEVKVHVGCALPQ